MVVEVLPYLANIFTFSIDLVFRVILGLGVFNLLFGAFIIYTVYRFLLVPLLGSGTGSDKARRKKGDEN